MTSLIQGESYSDDYPMIEVNLNEMDEIDMYQTTITCVHISWDAFLIVND